MGGAQTARQTGLKPGDVLASGKKLVSFQDSLDGTSFLRLSTVSKVRLQRNRFPLSPVCIMGATSERILPNELEIWG